MTKMTKKYREKDLLEKLYRDFPEFAKDLSFVINVSGLC
jgi:hypothetical protein